MEEFPERMRFIRYEVREGVTVAVFAQDMPVPEWEWDWDGEEQATETVFDRASLEARLTNLRASGCRADVTAAVLAAWPRVESRPPEAARPPADEQIPRQQRIAAVLRLLRGEEAGTVAHSLGVPAATLIAWHDAFLTAGNSALEP